MWVISEDILKKSYEIRLTRLVSMKTDVFFNMLGIVGWYFNGNVCKSARINPSASNWYNKL